MANFFPAMEDGMTYDSKSTLKNSIVEPKTEM
jgi:hypothetical protein